jgi:hypothetical protein
LEAEIKPFFNSNEIKNLAKESKFVRRQSGKIDGQLFLDLIVFNNDCLKNQSLNDLTVALEERYKIQITKQSLHERFNEYALVFLQKAMESLLGKQLNLDYLENKIQGIKRILIKDSVCFQVDQSLADIYPGSRGSASDACVRIQFEYDLLNGRINDLSLSSYAHQDAKNSSETIEMTRTGDLIIRDLAYMEIKVLRALIKKSAFFLCRLNPKVAVYTRKKSEDAYQIVDFLKITRHMRKKKLNHMEKTIYIGAKKKIRLRLIIYLLPDHMVAQRIRELKNVRSKKGRKLKFTPKYKARLALNLFLTNTHRKQLSTRNAWPLYRLRWQIELIFKTWKSFAAIDKVKKVQRYRLQCYIYSKLILILIGWKIIWRVAMLMEEKGKKLSILKAFKSLLGTKFEKFRRIFILKNIKIKDFMVEFFKTSLRKHLLEKKKGKPTSYQLLMVVISKGKIKEND